MQELAGLLAKRRPLVMGILNLTPDSFSDGGAYEAEDIAVRHALRMADEGADIIDIGGESTRPGSRRVDEEEQRRRVLPIIERLQASLSGSALISIDTTLSAVAAAALDAGASIINDVSAGRDDEKMFALARDRNAPIILMHMQGAPNSMQENPLYADVVEEVCAFLIERAEAAQRAGVPKENIIIDPGIGFGKTREHNLTLMANLERFVATGYPVLLGTSRKRFMGAVCNETEPRKLVGATCASTAIGVMAGVQIFRVHDVAGNRQSADVAWAILASR